MKRFLISLALVAAEASPVFVIWGLMACSAPTVERETLVPAVRMAWPAVRSDAELGGAPPADLAALDRAVESGSFVGAPEIAAYARAGIAARVASGEIGPGVAGSFEERLAQFERATALLRGEQ